MKKAMSVVLIMFCVSVFTLGAAYAAKPDKINGVARITHSGDIKGKIDLVTNGCVAEATDPLKLQVLVYVPGTSIVARAVPVNGIFEFRLFDVPEGTQTVLVDVLDPAAGTLTTITLGTTIIVKRQIVLDLQTLSPACTTQ